MGHWPYMEAQGIIAQVISMEFWVAFGPICLGVAGYFLVSELGRIRKKIHALRQTTTQTSIDVASIKEAMKAK